jgi:hypothetical protein
MGSQTSRFVESDRSFADYLIKKNWTYSLDGPGRKKYTAQCGMVRIIETERGFEFYDMTCQLAHHINKPPGQTAGFIVDPARGGSLARHGRIHAQIDPAIVDTGVKRLRSKEYQDHLDFVRSICEQKTARRSAGPGGADSSIL